MARARRAMALAPPTRSTTSSSCPTPSCRSTKAPLPPGRVGAASISSGSSKRSPPKTRSPWTSRGASFLRRPPSCCSMARAPTSGSRCSTRIATDGPVPTRRVTRASCPICAAAIPSPSPTASASRSRDTCVRSIARPATALGCVHSHWRSRSTTSAAMLATLPISAACPSAMRQRPWPSSI